MLAPVKYGFQLTPKCRIAREYINYPPVLEAGDGRLRQLAINAQYASTEISSYHPLLPQLP